MAEANDNALVEGSAAELAVLDVTDTPADKPGTGKPAKRRNKHRSKAVEVEVIEMDKCKKKAPVPEMPKEPQMAAVLQLFQVLYSEVISDHGLANPLTVCMCWWSIDCQ